MERKEGREGGRKEERKEIDGLVIVRKYTHNFNQSYL